jgi:hypothetical protein
MISFFIEKYSINLKKSQKRCAGSLVEKEDISSYIEIGVMRNKPLYEKYGLVF